MMEPHNDPDNKENDNGNVKLKKSELRKRNKGKPRHNFTRISKYLHILIFEYL